MQKSAIEALRAQLDRELIELNQEDASTTGDRATVQLDQTSVGRLSRMDALQRQALAQATQRRRNTRRTRIAAALKRMDEGEFGYCVDCGEDISKDRLELDPTITLCLECAAP